MLLLLLGVVRLGISLEDLLTIMHAIIDGWPECFKFDADAF